MVQIVRGANLSESLNYETTDGLANLWTQYLPCSGSGIGAITVQILRSAELDGRAYT